MADLTTEYYGPLGSDSLWPYSNTGAAVAAGDMVPLVTGTSGFVGVANGDIAATTGTGTLITRGLRSVSKATGEAFTVGQIVYFDFTTLRTLTGTATTTFTRAGRVVVAAASAATSAIIALNA